MFVVIVYIMNKNKYSTILMNHKIFNFILVFVKQFLLKFLFKFKFKFESIKAAFILSVI